MATLLYKGAGSEELCVAGGRLRKGNSVVSVLDEIYGILSSPPQLKFHSSVKSISLRCGRVKASAGNLKKKIAVINDTKKC